MLIFIQCFAKTFFLPSVMGYFVKMSIQPCAHAYKFSLLYQCQMKLVRGL